MNSPEPSLTSFGLPERPTNPTAKGSAYLSGAQGLLIVLGYALNVVLARYLLLAEGEYGLWMTLTTVLLWVELAVQTGAPQTLTKAVSEDPRQLPAAMRTIWRVLVPASVVVAAVFAALVPVISLTCFRDRRLMVLLWVAAVDIPLVAVLTGARRSLEGLHAFGLSAAVLVIYAAARVVLILGLVWGSGHLVGAAIGKAAASAVGVVAAMTWLHRFRRRLPPAPEPPPMLSGHLIRFGLPMLALGLTISFLQNVGFWSVKAVLDRLAARSARADAGVAAAYKEMVDQFGAAYVLARVPILLCAGIGSAVFASMSWAVGRGDAERARSVGRESLRLYLVVATPMCLALAVAPGALMGVLFGPRFAQGGPALALLAVAAWLFGVMGLSTTMVTAEGRPRRVLVVVAVMLPAALAATALAVYRWTLVGGGVAQVAVAGLGAVVVSVQAWRLVGPIVPWRTARRVGIGTALGTLAALLVPLPAGPVQLARMAIALGVLALVVLALGEIRRSDLHIVRDVLTAGRRKGRGA